MITATVLQKSGQYTGLICKGHAGYAEDGYDIICAAVSVLTVNTINSIETFTDQVILSEEEGDGFVSFKLESPVIPEAELLMKSMVLGLEGIHTNYNKFIQLKFKEV